MRLFVFFVFGLIFLLQQSAVAQMTMGGNMYGTGQAMGQQPCPYVNPKSLSGKQMVLDSKAEQIKSQMEELTEKIEDVEEEMNEDLVSQDSASYDSERLPFKTNVAQSMANYIQNEYSCDEGSSTYKVGVGDGSYAITCTNSVSDLDQVCAEASFYNKPLNDSYVKKCQSWIKAYSRLNKERKEYQKEYDELDEDLGEIDEKLSKVESDIRRAERQGKSIEGVACVDCGAAEQQLQRNNKGLGTALFMDGVNLLGWYFGTKYVTDQNKKLGWATPPLALGLPGANATAGWYASQRYGGGMGAGSWGCTPQMGYATGPYGAGGPNGNISPYGSCGGAFGSPCMSNGYPMGYNPAAAGGIYAGGMPPPGYGVGGGYGGMPPPGYGMGGGYGMPGYGAGGVGNFGFGAGPNGQFGYGGSLNLFGGAGIGGMPGMPGMNLATGFNPNMYGMGGFPGAYMGGYGVSGGFGAGPGGSGSWYGPGGGGVGFGGMPGYGMPPPGYGMGGGYGGMPGYGMGVGFGGGGGYPGMPGYGMPGYGMGVGFGGGYGGMPPPGYGGYPGMPGYGVGGYGSAGANSSVIVQQLQAIEVQMYQLQGRYMYLSNYLNSGGGYYGGGYPTGPTPVTTGAPQR